MPNITGRRALSLTEARWKKKNGASANMWIHSLRIPYPNLSGAWSRV